jgi:hypothetical protein
MARQQIDAALPAPGAGAMPTYHMGQMGARVVSLVPNAAPQVIITRPQRHRWLQTHLHS